MSVARPGTPGATRTCPHCKTTILESANVCPSCRHHLRFDPDAAQSAQLRSVPLRVEGTIKPPPGDNALEYSVVLTIRNADSGALAGAGPLSRLGVAGCGELKMAMTHFLGLAGRGNARGCRERGATHPRLRP